MAKLLLCLSIFAAFASCQATASPSCADDPQGFEYRGLLNVTLSGRPCQAWSSQTPHVHYFTPDRYPNAGITEGNYCRHPYKDAFTAWCYTTTDLRWEYCAVGAFAPECRIDTECYTHPNGSDYRGTVSTTMTGKTCQNWTAQSPHVPSSTPEKYPDGGLGDHNYCRNPDPEGPGTVPYPWCYTTDPNTRYEMCNVGPNSCFC